MTEEQPQHEEEAPWWEKPDVPEEQRDTVKELMDQLDQMKNAGQSMPRRKAIRLLGVGFMIVFNLYILYMAIGNLYASYTFIFCAINIIICLDDLSLARRLESIRKGEKKE